jgi:pantothenate kinase-related protein Tda10
MTRFLARRERLACLPYVEQATFDFATKCLDGTRTELLEELLSWASATGPDEPRVLWLRGCAGMGKSTIAASFAQLLQDSEHLGGSFFFSRSVADRSSSLDVFSTLASQLIIRIPRLSESISKVIEERPDVGLPNNGDYCSRLP